MIPIQLKKKGDETIKLKKKAINKRQSRIQDVKYKLFNHFKNGKLFFLRNFEMHNLLKEEGAWL
jgi:hypothetical protein